MFHKGDAIKVLPSGNTSTIESIDVYEGPLESANAPMSVTITLKDEIDISRGDMLVPADQSPTVSQDIELMICWLSEKKLAVGGKYAIRHTTKDARCIVKSVEYRLNISTMETLEDETEIGVNDIGKITIKTTQPLVFDSYRQNRITGCLILIDEATNTTVGAGMIL